MHFHPKNAVRVVGLLALLLGAIATASPRVVIMKFAGDKQGKFQKQIHKDLCSAFECVPGTPFMKKGVLNWHAAAQAHVRGVFTGQMKAVKGHPTLQLSLQVSRTGTPTRWMLSPKGGAIPAAQLSQVIDDTQALFVSERNGAAAAPPPPAEPPAATPPVAAAPSASEPAPEPSPSRQAPEEKKAAEPQTVDMASASSSASASESTAPLAALEVGVDLLHRSFTYSSLSTANLLEYSAPIFVAPHFHGELYPLAKAVGSPWSGIGIEADYDFSVGLQSSFNGGTSHPTSYQFIEAGLRWNLPLGDIVTLTPSLEYQWTQFSVGPDSTGEMIQGLPNVRKRGFVLGLEGDFALGGGVHLFAGVKYLPSMTGPDLIGPSYFANGSMSALDLRLGLSVEIVKSFSLSATGIFMDYLYKFTTATTDTYIASGATESYVGGRIAAKYTF